MNIQSIFPVKVLNLNQTEKKFIVVEKAMKNIILLLKNHIKRILKISTILITLNSLMFNYKLIIIYKNSLILTQINNIQTTIQKLFC